MFIPMLVAPTGRTLVRRATLVLGVAAALLGLPGPVVADTPTVAGWWTALSVVNPLPVGPTVINPPPEPDVPPGGMLVEGGLSADQPLAFGAVSYYLPDGQTVTRLDLPLAVAGSALTAKLRACPLQLSTFAAAQGGPMSSAPAYDCGRHVEGSASADGTAYSFAVASLVHDGQLGVAIIPESLLDRVVFAAPGMKTVVTGPLSPDSGAPAAPSTSPPAGAAAPSAKADTPTAVASGPSATGADQAALAPQSPASDGQAVPPPAVATSPAAASTASTAPAGPQQASALTTLAAPAAKSHAVGVLLAALGAVAALVLWRVAGHSASRERPATGGDGL